MVSILRKKKEEIMSLIAVIDDDVYIGDMLERLLTKNGYQVIRAYSGTEAEMMLSGTKPDVILLDLMLPGLSGEELLRRLKEFPVIIISAKTDVRDKMEMLMEGAADYMTKPFDNQELLARIAVQLRNVREGYHSRNLVFGDLKIVREEHQAYVKDQKVRLTKTEYAILKLFLQNPRQVLTKSVILDRIQQETPDCVESSLKVHVSNLRKKLREVGQKDYIEAVWGIGFKLREE